MRFQLVAGALGAMILAVPATAETIAGRFNGFCDGFIVKTRPSGGVSGSLTGCASGKVAGVFSPSQIVYSFTVSPPLVVVVNASPRTFFIYNSKGKVALSGTWSPGVPPGPAPAGSPSAMSSASQD